MSLAEANRRGWALKARFAVNGIQKGSRSLAALPALGAVMRSSFVAADAAWGHHGRLEPFRA
ncbi:hypothetical protein D9M69_677500 [compost metagenome]